MSDRVESSVGTQGSPDAQWRVDLAQGLLKPLETCRQGRLSELGLPALSEIGFSDQLVYRHPLREYIVRNEPLSGDDLHGLLRHPALDLSLVGYHSGAVTAAVQNQLMKGEREGLDDYSRNMWARDGIITAAALNRAGYPDKAHMIVKRLWRFAGGEEHRSKILQFHWGGPDVTRRLFLEGNNVPHIKYSVSSNGQLEFCNHEWAHQQLDALGAMVWAPYRFANLRGGSLAGWEALDLRKLDPMPWASDSILPAAIKMLHGVHAHDTADFGPWEDVRAWRRATSVGIVLAALQEARMFHDREGWDFLPVEYNGRQDGVAFREQLEETLYNCLSTVQQRIPEIGLAVECDERPCDSAMIFLLSPFDCNLKVERQNTILRTIYKNMGEAGFRRWDAECLEGPDRYVGQDYFVGGDPRNKGEFAELCEGFRPAEWSLFDPLLSAFYYRRFIESGGLDREAFLYGDKHLKRTLSYITCEPHSLHVVGKKEVYEIPAGILPEAFAWDSARREWRPNHNSPLLMAQGALGIALERAQEACKLWRVSHGMVECEKV